MLILIFGLGWGSFATMSVYRIPNGEPWIGRRPFCNICNHDLRFFDYISILSFFTHRGKCRYCNSEYKSRNLYLATELLMLSFFVKLFYPSNSYFLIRN